MFVTIVSAVGPTNNTTGNVLKIESLQNQEKEATKFMTYLQLKNHRAEVAAKEAKAKKHEEKTEKKKDSCNSMN